MTNYRTLVQNAVQGRLGLDSGYKVTKINDQTLLIGAFESRKRYPKRDLSGLKGALPQEGVQANMSIYDIRERPLRLKGEDSQIHKISGRKHLKNHNGTRKRLEHEAERRERERIREDLTGKRTFDDTQDAHPKLLGLFTS